jgi:hypothetical protein
MMPRLIYEQTGWTRLFTPDLAPPGRAAAREWWLRPSSRPSRSHLPQYGSVIGQLLYADYQSRWIGQADA